MKKNTIRAFTLVEMLIVIVIIGILIAALLPRMQAAQGRARDVSRKTALSQVQSAIVSHQGDHGQWPWSGELASDGNNSGIALSTIQDTLINAGMSEVPKDPLAQSSVSGLGGGSSSSGEYLYMVSKRNGSNNAGFVLMAKTEVAGGSNWVVCGSSSSDTGFIAAGTDLKDVHPCPSVDKGSSCTNPNNGTTACTYSGEDQLRYIVLY